MNLKEKRESLNLTQEQLAEMVDMSVRTISRYENSDTMTFKHKYIYSVLEEYGRVDEEHGILTIEHIIKTVEEVANKYNVEFIYLFGSYARNEAKDNSDIDLLVKTDVTGLEYFGLIEELRTTLKKKVDFVPISDLIKNEELLVQILKEGLKIYEENKE